MSLTSGLYGLSREYWQSWSISDGVQDNLSPGEEWIGSWSNVGLYNENDKIPELQVLTVHLTTHRLILIPIISDTPVASSSRHAPLGLSTLLSHIRQTEFYAGFMRSSAKITLALGPPNPSTTTSTGNGEPVKSVSIDTYTDQGWTCGVCGYSNPTDVGMGKCGLCGVPYSVSQAAMSSFSQGPSRTSTPTPRPISTMSATAPPEISQISSEITTSLEEGIPCPACTFLNHTSMTFCEICSTRLKTSTSRKANITGPDMSDPSGGRSQSKQEVVRLSFRGGGEKVAYQKLKSVLTQKAWEKSQKTRRDKENGEVKSGAGIDGIMNTLSLDAKEQEEHVKESFRDLELLMVRAGEMVRLAQSLSAKLSASSSPSESETSLIHNSLVQLGLPAPALTPDMVSTDRAYHTGLAKELTHLLLGKTGHGGLMNQVGKGVIGLDEVWGFWMRARGVALLPPSTLISVLPYLATQTSIRDLTLPSGLRVLHTKSYDPISILHRILVLLTPSAHSPSSEVLTATSAHNDPASLPPILPTSQTAVSSYNSTNLSSSDEGGFLRDNEGESPRTDNEEELSRISIEGESSRTDNEGESSKRDNEGKSSMITNKEKYITIIQLSFYESLPIGLTQELMEYIELLQLPEASSISVTLGDERLKVGGTQFDAIKIKGLVRDDQAQGGVRWYRDLITPWIL